MMTELYFKDQSDKWKKEEIACERPSDIFTAESWRRLEKQKEVTAKSAIHECFPGGCISCILPDFFCSVLRHLIFLIQKSPTPSDQSDPNSQRSTCSNIYGASVKSFFRQKQDHLGLIFSGFHPQITAQFSGDQPRLVKSDTASVYTPGIGSSPQTVKYKRQFLIRFF